MNTRKGPRQKAPSSNATAKQVQGQGTTGCRVAHHAAVLLTHLPLLERCARELLIEGDWASSARLFRIVARRPSHVASVVATTPRCGSCPLLQDRSGRCSAGSPSVRNFAGGAA